MKQTKIFKESKEESRRAPKQNSSIHVSRRGVIVHRDV
jgi:hypothetical protein